MFFSFVNPPLLYPYPQGIYEYFESADRLYTTDSSSGFIYHEKDPATGEIKWLPSQSDNYNPCLIYQDGDLKIRCETQWHKGIPLFGIGISW